MIFFYNFQSSFIQFIVWKSCGILLEYHIWNFNINSKHASQ